MRICRVFTLLACVAVLLGPGRTVGAQAQEPSRVGLIEQAQAERVKTLHPYPVTTFERIMNKVEDITVGGGLHWHPFLENAYRGGGFAVGVGYMHHVSPYNLLDVRGSYSIRSYKRAEVEFMAPRMFRRRGSLSLLGGYREATQVGFYGIGTDSVKDDRANYAFDRWYGSATMTVQPTRRLLTLRGGLELTEWNQKPGEGTAPSVETVYEPATLSGLGSRITYLHTQGTVGLDWRTSADYSRRGGFYGVTLHDYKDSDDEFGFQQVDYEVVQHFPILRETWAISLRALIETTWLKGDQEIPYFMLPSLGGGSNLRGYSSWRFRDRNSLLLQGEWRIMVNRYLDTAFFYDAGKVTRLTSDLDLEGLKHDFGFGLRFHTPISTPLRIDLAKSPEGLSLVFSNSAAF
jgi:outer membrane protein assembly factor BamA